MFKNNEKRFEYDIGPSAEEIDRYSYKYSNNRSGSEYPISATTPLNRRVTPNQTTIDAKDRHHISVQDPQLTNEHPEERYPGRSRGNSASGFKKSQEKPMVRNDRPYTNQNSKQTKKVYLGGSDDLFPKDQSNYRQQNTRGGFRSDQNTRINGQDLTSFHLVDNSHLSSTKGMKEPKKRQQKREIPEYNLNQKEIMDKIGRINRLNEQINSRLQRMLSKIQQQ